MNPSAQPSAQLAEISAQLSALQRSIARLRHARFTGLFLVFLLGCGVGVGSIGAVLFSDYQYAKRAEAFLSRFRDAGIDISLQIKIDGSREITVTDRSGSYQGGTRLPNEAGVVLSFKGDRR